MVERVIEAEGKRGGNLSNRIEWIDALKGFAICSVVVGHCVTDSISSNTFPDYENFLKLLFDIIYSFHMPLFFIISGFVFYLSKSYRRFKLKVLDFVVIYVIWCFITWLLKFLMADVVNNPVTMVDLLSIVYKPIMVYWYLYVLIIMYIATSLLKWEKVDGRLLAVAALVAVGSKLLHFNIGIGNAFLYYMYFFLAGGYCLQSNLINRVNIVQILLLSLLMSMGCAMFFIYQPSNQSLIIMGKFLLANVISFMCFFMFFKIKTFGILVLIGFNTLPIYVMHCFFTAALRGIFIHMNISNIYLYFILGTLLGIMVPIIISYLFKQMPLLNIMFEPTSSLKKLGGAKIVGVLNKLDSKRSFND